ERELETIAAACAARLRVAGIPDEQELGVELEIPQRRRYVELLRGERANPELDPARFDERIDALGLIAGHGVHRDRRAARVVAVEALPRARVDLDLVTQRVDQIRLRGDDRVGRAAGVRRIDAL